MAHIRAKSPHGWSLKQGLAAQYGAQAGIDPNLAASAGEAGWDALKSLRDAVDERDPARRAKRVKMTQRYLANADLGRDLVRAIQQRLAALSQANRAQPSINPETGLQEFALCSMWNPDCENVADPIPTVNHVFTYDSGDYTVADPISTVNHVFTYDANGTLLPGQHRPDVNVYSGDNFGLPPSSGGVGVGNVGGNVDAGDIPSVTAHIIPPDDLVPANPDTSEETSFDLNRILSDVRGATDSELELAHQKVWINASLAGTAIAAGFAFGGLRSGALPVTLGMGAGSYYALMINRIAHEIQIRKDAGVWTGD